MKIERVEGAAVMRLEAGRANAIGPVFLEQLRDLVAEVVAEPPAALVITGKGRAFSAGLDIPALLELDRAGMAAHMSRFNETMQAIFELPLPVVAAVNGHAIAGGCVLAMQADERLMAEGNAKIGLNEVTLGIGLPTIVLESFASQVGPEARRRVAQAGELVEPEEALRLGIVHGLRGADELVDAALTRARELGALGPGFVQVKGVLRRPVAARTAQYGAADDESWLDTWFSDLAQAQLKAVAARLKG